MFGWELRGRKKRIAELAGMVKEVGKGNIDKLDEIVGIFGAKTGLTDEVANGYKDQLIKAKLIVITYGEETWVYNGEREQEIFGINI